MRRIPVELFRNVTRRRRVVCRPLVEVMERRALLATITVNTTADDASAEEATASGSQQCGAEVQQEAQTHALKMMIAEGLVASGGKSGEAAAARSSSQIGNAKAANIFWQVGSSATLGTTSVFKGTIMADQSITLANGATLEGRALARIANVTMDSNAITIPAP